MLDGYRSGFVNEPEAAQVVALIREMCADPDYDAMAFGVISLLGTAQSKRIWELLYDQLGPDVLAQRQIRCGEAANFPGDERDVIVLTTVVARDPNAASTRFSAMTGTAPLRRINVAASRARNQMWVVTSVDPQDLPTGRGRSVLDAINRAGHESNENMLREFSAENVAQLRTLLQEFVRIVKATEVQ